MWVSSAAREKDLRGASERETQWDGGFGRGWERNLWRCTGVELRRSSGVYQRFTQTRSLCLSRGTLADQKCLL